MKPFSNSSYSFVQGVQISRVLCLIWVSYVTGEGSETVILLAYRVRKLPSTKPLLPFSSQFLNHSLCAMLLEIYHENLSLINSRFSLRIYRTIIIIWWDLVVLAMYNFR